MDELTAADIADMQASNEQDHVEEDPAYWEHYGMSEFFDYSPVEMGLYDDDPSPYDGTYSEM